MIPADVPALADALAAQDYPADEGLATSLFLALRLQRPLLLEILSDWSVTVPELGTVKATVPPVVVITSNRTRDVHDALKRRCLYHWVEHPTFERELAIVELKVPEASAALSAQVAAAVEGVRELRLYKPPGVAETIDW